MKEVYKSKSKVKGYYTRDVAHYVEKGKVVRSEVLDEGSNIIVADISKVLAGMFHGKRFEITNEAFTVSARDSWMNLKLGNLVFGTVEVKNNAGTYTYQLGVDYDIDYYAGRIFVKGTGSIPLSSTIRLSYQYTQNLFWAVGSGDVAWETDPDPSVREDSSTTQLVNEYFRKRIPYESFSFLDSNNQVVSGPTNRIQIVLMFEENEANGTLREFAIVGYDANTSLNSGVLIDHKIHKRIDKTSNLKLERTIRFSF